MSTSKWKMHAISKKKFCFLHTWKICYTYKRIFEFIFSYLLLTLHDGSMINNPTIAIIRYCTACLLACEVFRLQKVLTRIIIYFWIDFMFTSQYSMCIDLLNSQVTNRCWLRFSRWFKSSNYISSIVYSLSTVYVLTMLVSFHVLTMLFMAFCDRHRLQLN